MKKDKKKGQVKWYQSIQILIIFIIALAIIGTAFLNYIIVIPNINKDYKELTKKYMFDVTASYGEIASSKVREKGLEVFTEETEKQRLGGIHINGKENSYAYAVSLTGTMLYHPNEDKIGNPVENAVVTEIIKQIAAGETYTTKVETYEYNGEIKYAGIYVDKTNGFLLVVAADEADALTFLEEISKITILADIGAFVLWTVLGAILAIFIIIRPIHGLTTVIQKITNLDFTEDEVNNTLAKRKEEIGLISRNVEILRSKLQDVVCEIKGKSNNVYDTAEDLNNHARKTLETVEEVDKAVQEIAEGATSQAEDIQKATENVILMGNMVEETNYEIKQLYENAEGMKVASDEASMHLKAFNGINQKTRESMQEIYQQTNTTNESALKIREATNIITSIAQETNLLSLNASIEAARAGEQGRGFAVVASQIQKLAEESNGSATQIEAIIDSLISDSKKAVATMDRVIGIMNEQNEKVDKTGGAFELVQRGIDKSLLSVKEIKEKSMKLDHVRANIVDVVQNLSAIAEENAATTEETSASTTQVSSVISEVSKNADYLRRIAEELEVQMKDFRIEK